MSDLLRVRRRPARARATSTSTTSSLTAAARILQQTQRDSPQPQGWHPEAWDMRDTVGEVRYAEMWNAGTMSRARLVAARRARPGADPEPLEESHPAAELVASLAGGVGGQQALLRAFGIQLMTPGEAYLVGRDPRVANGPASWEVRSALEVRLSPTQRGPDGRPYWEVATGDEADAWDVLDDGLAARVWRPHPRRKWLPDSPVYGAMTILRELRLLTQAIEASALSRLAGAGLLLFPAEMKHPGTWNDFVKVLTKTLTTPIKDRAAAAAVMPFPMKIPGEWLDKVKHVTFASPFDEHALKLRTELIQRLGTAMDLPVQQLTGEVGNHWDRAQAAEEGVQLHTVPGLETVCHGLTRGYLDPGLLRAAQRSDPAAESPDGGRLLALASEAQQVTDDDGGEYLVWYDLSDFEATGDRGDDAQVLFDRWEAGGDVLRSALGLSEAEAPTGEEIARRVWLKLIEGGGDAELVKLALRKLGLVEEAELPAAPPAPIPIGPAAPEPADEAPSEQDPPPSTPGTQPDDEDPADDERRPAPERRAATVIVLPPRPDHRAVVGVADGLVARALEKCGNRLRTRARRQIATDASLDLPAVVMHTCLNAGLHMNVDELLAGAWDRLDELAPEVGADVEELRAKLDAYTRGLIRSRRPHSWALLSAYLAPPADERPLAEQVLAASAARR